MRPASALLFLLALGFTAGCGAPHVGPARPPAAPTAGQPESPVANAPPAVGEPELPATEEPSTPLVSPDQPIKTVTYSKADRPTIRCEPFWRASVVADPSDPKLSASRIERVELHPGARKDVKLGPFAVSAHYEVHDEEGDSLIVDVKSSVGDGSRQLFQLDGRVMQRPGPRGFTGLVYRTAPNRPDELQYWCALAR